MTPVHVHPPKRKLGAANRRILLLAAVILVLFLYGIGRVTQLRYSVGDVYPPYSTHRFDPLGASAFYYAMESMPELEVKRNQRSLSAVGELEDTTLILLGTADTNDPVYLLEIIEAFVEQGNRLVVAYSATAIPWWDAAMEEVEREEKEALDEARRQRRMMRREQKEEKAAADSEAEEGAETELADQEPVAEEGDGDADSPEESQRTEPPTPEELSQMKNENDAEKEDEEKEEEDDPFYENIAERWGFMLEQADLKGDEDSLPYTMALEAVDADLSETLEMYSPIRMTELSQEWEVIYHHEGEATVIERVWGDGSIVMVSGSYLFSNEAVRNHRSTQFLSWIAGAQGTILFDETHLGVQQQVGVMGLIKRFKLVPLLLTLLVLVSLHIWKSVATLIPRQELEGDREALRDKEGQSDAAGLTNLMRRGVPPKLLLQECYRAWQHDFGRNPRYKGKVEQELRSLIDGRTGGARWQEMVVKNYAAACRALRGRR